VVTFSIANPSLPALQELTQQNRWVPWRLVPRTNDDGEIRLDKIPLDFQGGYPTDPHNTSNQITYSRACDAVDRLHATGVGYVLVAADNYTALDCDRCRDAQTGTLEPWAAELIRRFSSYTEVTPSREGVRIWVHGQWSGKKHIYPQPGRAKAHLEVYSQKRFLTVTGEHLIDSPPEVFDRQPELDQFVTELEPGGPNHNTRTRSGGIEQLSEQEIIRRLERAFPPWCGNGCGLTDSSRSGIRMSIICKLVFFCGSNSTKAKRIAEQSPFYFALDEEGRRDWERLFDREFQRAHDLNRQRYERETHSANGYRGNDHMESTGKPNDSCSDATKLTEEVMAQRFEERYSGKLLYDHSRSRWYKWDNLDAFWRLNETREGYHFARVVCRSSNHNNKKELARATTYGGVERICQASPVFAVTDEKWDRDPFLLGVPGATVDLRTGREFPPGRTDYITKQTAVAPDWKQPRPVFDRFLAEITAEDAELQGYLQRIAGYALTGSSREEKLFFIYGKGSNGKTKFLEALRGAFGDYAVNASMDTFVVKHGERHPTDIARLVGARLVTASETTEGRHWDQALVQQMTGGDKLTARFMRQDFFEYTPQFTLMITGNHAPNLSSVDDAARRRLRIIPFTFQPKEPDVQLPDKLRKEWPAILAWAIDGAREWYTNGLGDTPQCVSNETAEYFEDQDQVRAWIVECCLVGENFSDTSEHLFANWDTWAQQNKEIAHTKTWLIRTLKRQHGCKEDRSKGRGLSGIAVNVKAEPNPRTGERDDDIVL
jgi:P4 family phage/plasmid primase-like protien